MRFRLRRTCKILAAVATCALVYYLYGSRHQDDHSLSFPVHLAHNNARGNGAMKVIGDFWTPEKDAHLVPGPGDNGEPVETKPEDENQKSKAYGEYGFNQFVSDKISLHRSLRDVRDEA